MRYLAHPSHSRVVRVLTGYYNSKFSRVSSTKIRLKSRALLVAISKILPSYGLVTNSYKSPSLAWGLVSSKQAESWHVCTEHSRNRHADNMNRPILCWKRVSLPKEQETPLSQPKSFDRTFIVIPGPNRSYDCDDASHSSSRRKWKPGLLHKSCSSPTLLPNPPTPSGPTTMIYQQRKGQSQSWTTGITCQFY